VGGILPDLIGVGGGFGGADETYWNYARLTGEAGYDPLEGFNVDIDNLITGGQSGGMVDAGSYREFLEGSFAPIESEITGYIQTLVGALPEGMSAAFSEAITGTLIDYPAFVFGDVSTYGGTFGAHDDPSLLTAFSNFATAMAEQVDAAISTALFDAIRTAFSEDYGEHMALDAGEIDDLLSGMDLETAATYVSQVDAFIAGMLNAIDPDRTSTYAYQLEQLDAYFDAQIQVAESLGVSTDLVMEAYDAAAARLAASFNVEPDADPESVLPLEAIHILEDIAEVLDTSSMTDAEEELYKINARYDDMVETLIDLGVVISDTNLEQARSIEINAALAETEAALAEAREQANDTAIATAESALDTIEAGLADIETQAASALSAMTATGATIEWAMAEAAGTSRSDYIAGQITSAGTPGTFDDIEQIAALYSQYFEARIDEEVYASEQVADNMTAAAQAAEEVRDSIDATVQGIQYSSLNVALPSDQLTAAGTDYSELFNAAMGGSSTAIDEYLNFASTYLTSAQDVYKSSGAYSAIYDSVMEDIAAVRGGVTAEETETDLASIYAEYQDTMDRLTDTTEQMSATERDNLVQLLDEGRTQSESLASIDERLSVLPANLAAAVGNIKIVMPSATNPDEQMEYTLAEWQERWEHGEFN
jgi:uncharacterized protein YicC (UPF0701 family)